MNGVLFLGFVICYIAIGAFVYGCAIKNQKEKREKIAREIKELQEEVNKALSTLH